MKLVRAALISFAVALMPLAAQAQEAHPVLEKWYAALFDIDRASFETLLADGAVVKLEDFGVEQTKTEFIDALDEWEDASKDADFAWQIDPEAPNTGDEATALVCYRFPTNTLMTREAFRFQDGKVFESVQKSIGDSCDDF